MKILGPWLFYIFSFVMVKSPRWVGNAVGDFVGFLWFDVFRIRRKVVLDNLKIAFPNKSHDERVQIGRKNLRNLGRLMVRFSDLVFMDRKMVSERFAFHGLEHLEAGLAKGRGVCLLTLHLGCGDLSIGALSTIGYPMYLVAKKISAGWLDKILVESRERLGTKSIDPRYTSLTILKALKRQGVVIFVHDQFMGPPIGCASTFFGHPTGTALGLAVIANRSNAPVVPAYSYVDENDIVHTSFDAEIPYAEENGKRVSLEAMTQIYNDHIEKYVARYPEQWMWIHRRWKKFGD
jgi:KDO2-lipid IV(A) lauroyltransferase